MGIFGLGGGGNHEQRELAPPPTNTPAESSTREEAIKRQFEDVQAKLTKPSDVQVSPSEMSTNPSSSVTSPDIVHQPPTIDSTQNHTEVSADFNTLETNGVSPIEHEQQNPMVDSTKVDTMQSTSQTLDRDVNAGRNSPEPLVETSELPTDAFGLPKEIDNKLHSDTETTKFSTDQPTEPLVSITGTLAGDNVLPDLGLSLENSSRQELSPEALKVRDRLNEDNERLKEDKAKYESDKQTAEDNINEVEERIAQNQRILDKLNNDPDYGAFVAFVENDNSDDSDSELKTHHEGNNTEPENLPSSHVQDTP